MAPDSCLTNGDAPHLTNGDQPDVTNGDEPALAARPDVEPSVSEPVSDAEPVSATQPAEYDAAFVDESAAEETQTAAAAEAEPIDDDWFATEAGEADATSEPMHPTPAFSDLRGIERLATDAALNEPLSEISTDAGLNDVNAAADSLATVANDATAADRDVENSAQSASVASMPAAATPAHDALASVVDVLERTAHRIRDGQLALPSDLATASDAAALAAVLTALLRTPRE